MDEERAILMGAHNTAPRKTICTLSAIRKPVNVLDLEDEPISEFLYSRPN
jgi:hypothetical protein